jgi:hypothetical protein
MRQTTEWWDHARSLTCLRTYAPGAQTEGYGGVEAFNEAVARVEEWRRQSV